MNTGAITGHIDVAQIVLYAFWIFFAGLIYYLRREDKREGYPLEYERPGSRIVVQGWPAMPPAKIFTLADGSVVKAPRVEHDPRPFLATPLAPFVGAPYQPLGDAMADAVGPAAYAARAEVPDRMLDGRPMIVPLRLAPGFSVDPKDPDPRGMTVYGADDEAGGVVRDLWIDRAEPQIRYLEVEAQTRRVLLPITVAKIDGSRRRINVRSVHGAQLAGVPALANADQVTRREEDRISAYYAGGNLYATAGRAEPLL